jgi:iron complex outermembrane recepter protein
VKKARLSNLKSTTASLVLGLAIISTPSYAQDAAAEEEAAEEGSAIVVTGSRITRPDLEVASPVNVLTSEDIAREQVNSAEELLRDIPGVRPSIGPGVNNGTDGSSSVNLRGLGDNRTLVLLDGRRIVPFGLDGITDLNTIPIALIERVDVVTGGASSVYGADAVAGVVNFITKRDFAGFEASAGYRLTSKGDARSFKADVVLGANFDDGRGNVVLGLGYTDTEALNQDRRSFGVAALSTVNGQPQGSQTAVPSFLIGPSITGVTSATLGAVYDPGLGQFRTPTQGDLYNFNPDNLYQTPLERYNIFAQGRYEISEAVEAYANAMFTRNKVVSLAAPSGSFTNPYRLPISNPYLTAAARAQLCTTAGGSGTFFNSSSSTAAPFATTQAACLAAAGATSETDPLYREVAVTLARRFTEYGPRINSFESQQFQVQLGFRGNITDSLKYDLSAQYGETLQNQTRENWGSYSRVQQAMRAFNTASCSNTANSCVPINLFGPQGSITQPMINFFALDAQIRRLVTQKVVTGSISGDLFGLSSPLASNPVAFAVGAEWRNLTAETRPDASSQIQSEVLGTGARTPRDRGEYSVKEVFGELIAPLIEDKPFFYNLSLEAGVRHSDYTTTGSSTTWKVGGSWSPVEDVKLRGMYQVAVRSPNIQELFQSPVTGLSSLSTDPCQGALPVGNAALTALCVATGAPSTAIGFIPSPSANQINATTQGNRLLDVERAKTLTLGGVFTPSFVPNLSLTVDWFRIKVTEAITQPAQGDILNGCFSATLNPTLAFNGFCQLVGRNPINGSLNGAGETAGVILGFSNLGVIQTSGVDFGVRYKMDLSETAGSLGFALTGTWLDYWRFQANPLAINRDCTTYYSTNCTNPRPEWKLNGRLTYSNGPIDVSLMWRHLSAVRIEPAAPSPLPARTVPQTGGPNPANVFDAYEKIKAYNYFDLAMSAEAMENLQLNLTINNLFNKKPPVVGSGAGGTTFNNGNTFPTTYDVLGTTFNFGVRLKF